MKKKKILIALGAFVLTTGSFLVTKASKVFTSINYGYMIANGGTCIMTVTNLGSGFTTVAPGNHVVVLAVTATGGSYTKIATMSTGQDYWYKKIYHR